MSALNTTIEAIDRFNEYVARACSYLILVVSLIVVYDVLLRYFFKSPTCWAYESSYMMCSTFWLLGGAWTLKLGRHVNVDVFYANFSDRTKLIIDILYYIILYLPVVIFVLIYGTNYAWESWKAKELSHLSPWHPPIYPFKTLVPLTFFMLAIQGIAELIRSIWKFQALRRG